MRAYTPEQNISTLPDNHPAFKILCDAGLSKETIAKFPIRFNEGLKAIEFIYPDVNDYVVKRFLNPNGKGKYLSPKGKSKHLYIISTKGEIPLKWQPSAKEKFLFTEGIKKGQRIFQEATDSPLPYPLTIVAVDGISTFFKAPESTKILAAVKDKDVFITFDADSEENRDVRREELKLFATLRNCKSRQVKSVVWNPAKGKGIDDFLHSCPEIGLHDLLSQSISPIERAINNGSDVRVVVESLTKKGRLAKPVLQEFVSEIKTSMKKHTEAKVTDKYLTSLFQDYSEMKGEADIYAEELLALKYECSFSELHDRVFVNGSPLDDKTFDKIYCEMVNRGFKDQNLLQAVISRAGSQTPFHPVKDYLESLQWNGRDEIGKLSEYFKDKYTVFYCFFKKWIVGAVAKVFNPQHQNPVLVLVGDQGIGKGYFVQWLCPIPELYIAAPIAPENKDCQIRLAENWIWEIEELSSTTRKADIDALKIFLTLNAVKVRRPYAKFDLNKPAIASFIGTLNPDGVGFLHDTTGNRRFRPVDLLSINRDYAKHVDRNQLWAQAVALYKQGETSDFDGVDKDMMQDTLLSIQEEHREVSLMESLCQMLFEKAPEDFFLSTADILDKVTIAGYKRGNNDADSKSLSRAMKSLGFEKHCLEGRTRGYKGIATR